MTKVEIDTTKKNIIAIGRLLWEKDLASVLNGNISVRVDETKFLLTATKSCLGLLQEKDILLVGLDGKALEEGAVSTEVLMHSSVYKNFSDAKAVIHTHTTYTNAYFLENDHFSPKVYESKFWIGEIHAVPQDTPSVTEAGPFVNALRNNNIMVLKNHGTVAKGNNLFDCFLLIQSLEDAIKVDAISRLYSSFSAKEKAVKPQTKEAPRGAKKYKLFSKEQMDEIVRLVNEDKKLSELGEKTNMTMDLAVKMDESDDIYCFEFEKGRIKETSHKADAEFLITAPKDVWRAVFNQEVDPFVATTQKKMHLKGDFAKISKWYAPCSRIFELWSRVPVE